MSWILPGLEILPRLAKCARIVGEKPDPRKMVNARRAKWKSLNPERAKAQWTAWNNKPSVVASKKEWCARNKPHLAKMQRERRARQREVLS